MGTDLIVNLLGGVLYLNRLGFAFPFYEDVNYNPADFGREQRFLHFTTSIGLALGTFALMIGTNGVWTVTVKRPWDCKG